MHVMGAQWLSGRVLDSRLRGSGFKPHQRYCAVPLSKNINPSLVLVQPRKTCSFITDILLWDVKNQIKQTKMHGLFTVAKKSANYEICNILQVLYFIQFKRLYTFNAYYWAVHMTQF